MRDNKRVIDLLPGLRWTCDMGGEEEEEEEEGSKEVEGRAHHLCTQENP